MIYLGSDPFITDIIRALVIGLAALTVGATITVITLHSRAWRIAPSGSGIVPAHVVVISTAHLIYTVVAGIGVVERLSEPVISWRTIAYGVASILTLLALFIIGRFQARRVNKTNARVVTSTINTQQIDVDETDGGTPGGTRPSKAP